MTVHFIGAGPGAPDLLTLRGRDLIAACPVCLYAGSLVPKAVLAHCPPDARLVNTAPMALDAIMAEIRTPHAAGQDVARLQSGDLSVWSAMGEQLRRLRDEHGFEHVDVQEVGLGELFKDYVRGAEPAVAATGREVAS